MTVVAGFMTKAEHDAIDAARGDTSRNASQAVVFRDVIGNPLPDSNASSARCLICAGVHCVPGVSALAVCRDVGGERRDDGLRFKDGVVRSDLDPTSYETQGFDSPGGMNDNTDAETTS
jgi:hypothetical protein